MLDGAFKPAEDLVGGLTDAANSDTMLEASRQAPVPTVSAPVANTNTPPTQSPVMGEIHQEREGEDNSHDSGAMLTKATQQAFSAGDNSSIPKGNPKGEGGSPSSFPEKSPGMGMGENIGIEGASTEGIAAAGPEMAAAAS